MSKKPEILNSHIAAKSRLFTVESLHLKFANGQEREYERIIGPRRGAVMILPVLDDKTVLLIREYGAGVDDYVLGFPKGAIDPNEDMLMTANRELMEEVGYGARNLSVFTKFCTSPGYLSAVMHVILAQDLYEHRIPGDEPEPIEVIPWRLDRLDELFARPDFYEARSMAAILMLERWYRAK